MIPKNTSVLSITPLKYSEPGLCIQRYIVGCMSFITDGIGDIGRNEFHGIASVVTSRVAFGKTVET